MSNFSGYIIDFLFEDNPSEISSSIQAITSAAPFVNEGVLVNIEGGGVFTDNKPIGMKEYVHNGSKAISFLDDYYYRIHIYPNPLEFGYVLTDSEKDFYVWNAYFIAKTCSAMNFTNDDEFEIDGLTAPFLLAPLQETIYTITVPTEGSPEFEGSVYFDFAEEDEYTLLIITATRVTLFPWPPLQPMKESLEWLTNIIKSRNGSEQRISTRRIPRQGFEFSIYIKDMQEQAKLEALAHKWLKKSFGMPVWTEGVLHTTDINSSSTSITVDTTNADFRDDSLGVIWKSETEWEIIKIDTVSPTGLTLSTPTQTTITDNKYIMPLRVVQINAPIRRNVSPDGFEIANISMVSRENVLLDDYVAPTTYKSLPVLTDPTYAPDGIEKINDGDLIVSDYETGKFVLYSDSEFNINTQSHIFKNFTKAEAWQFRLFLHYLLGRLNTVWIPTFREDLRNTETIGSADVSFKVANVGLYNNMGLNDLRTDLAFVFPDGSIIMKEITGITEINATEELIGIDSALGVDVAVGGCRIGFLDKCRLADDKVEIEWEHLGYDTCQVDFVKVKA